MYTVQPSSGKLESGERLRIKGKLPFGLLNFP